MQDLTETHNNPVRMLPTNKTEAMLMQTMTVELKIDYLLHQIFRVECHLKFRA